MASERPGRDGVLLPGGDDGAAGVDVIVHFLDSAEDVAVDLGGDFNREAPFRLEQWDAGKGAFIVAAGTVDLKAHQGVEGGAAAAGEQVGFAVAEAGEFVGGQIDAAAVGVFAEVAEDIGELHGDAELFGVGEGVAAEADDVAHHQADDAGDAVAEQAEFGEVGVAGAFEVHAHTLDEFERVLLGEAGLAAGVFEQHQDGAVDGLAVHDGEELLAPGFELAAGGFHVRVLVDDVVGGAAEPVDAVGGLSQMRREEAGGEVEAFRALRRRLRRALLPGG